MIKRAFFLFLAFTIGMLGGIGYCRGDVVLNFHVGSYHDGPGYWAADTGELTPYNEDNPGAGLSFAFNRFSEVRAGGYKNSHYDNSFYVGGAVYTSSRRLVSVGLVGGFVTGYANQIKDATIEYSTIQPFIVPTVFINTGRVRFEVGHVPALSRDTYALTTFTTGVRF